MSKRQPSSESCALPWYTTSPAAYNVPCTSTGCSDLLTIWKEADRSAPPEASGHASCVSLSSFMNLTLPRTTSSSNE